jgi:hypothetical protein
MFGGGGGQDGASHTLKERCSVYTVKWCRVEDVKTSSGLACFARIWVAVSTAAISPANKLQCATERKLHIAGTGTAIQQHRLACPPPGGHPSHGGMAWQEHPESRLRAARPGDKGSHCAVN